MPVVRNGFIRTLSLDKRDGLLRDHLALAEKCVNTNVTHPMNQNQFDSFVSLTHNIGRGAFAKSSQLISFNNGITGSVFEN